MLENSWPGNVRQLQNVVFRAVTMSDSKILAPNDLDWAEGSRQVDDLSLESEEGLEQAVQRFEANLLTKLYPKFPSTRKLAQRLATSHTKIAGKLRKYGIAQG
jgi:TyrR family helix-turn-helix protein